MTLCNMTQFLQAFSSHNSVVIILELTCNIHVWLCSVIIFIWLNWAFLCHSRAVRRWLGCMVGKWSAGMWHQKHNPGAGFRQQKHKTTSTLLLSHRTGYRESTQHCFHFFSHQPTCSIAVKKFHYSSKSIFPIDHYFKRDCKTLDRTVSFSSEFLIHGGFIFAKPSWSKAI